jgi:hypothetical protein
MPRRHDALTHLGENNMSQKQLEEILQLLRKEELRRYREGK